MNETVSIELSANLELTAKEVFPDGVPDEWGVADVAAAIRESRNVQSFISDWCIDVDVAVCVSRPNPAYGGDDVLFGSPPPRWLHEREVVFW